MKGKATAVLFIVVFLLILAVVCTFLAGRDKNPEDIPEEVPSTSVIEVIPEDNPSQSVPAETAAPQSTPSPSPTPTPLPSPTPSPTPTPDPTPAPQTELGSGSFRSSTGAKIDIQADWSAKSIGNNQAEVKVRVSLNSYSIHLQAVPGSVNVNLGGQYVSLDAPAVDYDGNDLISTLLSEKTFTVDIPADGILTLAVEWHFGGSYGDTELPVIECGGSVKLAG